MVFYFCTNKKSFGNKMTLKPRVPKTVGTGEDTEIKRICVSQSINGCLTSIGCNLYINDTVYVYKCDVNQDCVVQPTINEVPDCFLTGENWLMKETEFELAYKFKILKQHLSNYANEPIYNFTYGIEKVEESTD